MAKEKEEPTVEAAPAVAPIIDPNTGAEVVPVPAGFDAHIEARGLNKPCEDC